MTELKFRTYVKGGSMFCKCGGVRVAGESYCRQCKNEKARENVKRYFELNPIQKLKADARSKAHVYLRRGKLTRSPCEICGEKAQMHHDDYNKPLDVRWLCKEHHNQWHKTNLPK